MTYFLTQDKLYLNVPFSQKDEAKEKGAKYDPNLKLWYLPPVKDPLDVEEFWSFLENTYEDRDQLKRMGAKFHSKIKKWFVPNTCKHSFVEFSKWWPENLKRFLLLNKYQIFRKEISSGQATVYQSINLENNGLYAIKIFDQTMDEKNTKKRNLDFQKEMSALDKLNKKRHKHIISAIDFGKIEETGQNFIISEWIDFNVFWWIQSSEETVLRSLYYGASSDDFDEEEEEEIVKELLEANINLSDKDAVKEIILPILEALNFCHKNNIYHRDVKPSNILIDFDIEEEELVSKLCDFGISKNTLNQSSNTLTKVSMYSDVWAPENVNALDEIKLQHTRDIYGWAATTIAFINHKIPEDDKELRSMLKTPEAKTFNKDFIKLLKDGINKKASNRPQNIADYYEKIAKSLNK